MLYIISQIVYKILKTPEFFYKNIGTISIALMPLSILYSLIYIILYYYKRFFCSKTLDINAKIICVGNLTLGGSGKTEICLSIGRILNDAGCKFCYLTKGYGRKSIDNLSIAKGFLTDDYEKYGDEPILLAEVADTYIFRDRIEFLLSNEAKNYDYIIMDDGLHDNRFKKDITIALFDEKYLDGNGQIVPSGPKRCPYFLYSKKIDYIIYTNSFYNKRSASIESILQPKSVFFSKILHKNKIANGDYIAFSGLGINEKFFSYLEKNNIKIVKKISFADHFAYKESDFEKLIDIQKTMKCQGIITTSKDFVKISEKFRKYFVEFKIFHVIESFDIEVKKIIS
ncbi:tetraacyldisaccharide 4'-kinase [Candidatus Deianiraea vastatrix]|uniref:tetraacyldisaccharide 4'-kinase n=1 Tax=Candidatus Deianiraea vastatrix TaxID=2163644 RepID=UPI001CA3D58D|nr:tetraacyldisaccharide 4'-kinase [Candidatus Deianiraea vastatrix]